MCVVDYFFISGCWFFFCTYLIVLYSGVCHPHPEIDRNVIVILKSVTGSRMNCRVTTVEGLPSSNGLNSSWQVFQRSIIRVPLSGIASSALQDTGNPPQHECLQIPGNPTVTNSTDRRISSQAAEWPKFRNSFTGCKHSKAWLWLIYR